MVFVEVTQTGNVPIIRNIFRKRIGYLASHKIVEVEEIMKETQW